MILLDIIVVALSNIPIGSFSIYAIINSANRLYSSTQIGVTQPIDASIIARNRKVDTAV